MDGPGPPSVPTSQVPRRGPHTRLESLCAWGRGEGGPGSAVSGESLEQARPLAARGAVDSCQHTFPAEGQTVSTVGFASQSLPHAAVSPQTGPREAHSGSDWLWVTCAPSAATHRTQRHSGRGSRAQRSSGAPSAQLRGRHHAVRGGQPGGLPPFRICLEEQVSSLPCSQMLTGRSDHPQSAPGDHTGTPDRPQELWGQLSSVPLS